MPRDRLQAVLVMQWEWRQVKTERAKGDSPQPFNQVWGKTVKMVLWQRNSFVLMVFQGVFQGRFRQRYAAVIALGLRFHPA